MAPTKKNENGSRPNRIRFIMLDADISDGNLSELTQAITSAIKPATGHIRQLPPRLPAPVLAVAGQPVATVDDEEETPDAEVEEPAGDDAPKTPKAKPKLPLPTYLHDLDMNGNGAPFKKYAEDKAPKSQVNRYLVSAMWLKEHGNSPTINIDKVYTCYKTAGWPIGIADWDANFRSSVKRDLMRRVSPGEYAITPIGEAQIQKAED
jgi:hypothetical protein